MALRDVFSSGFFRAKYLIPAVAANAVALMAWFAVQGILSGGSAEPAPPTTVPAVAEPAVPRPSTVETPDETAPEAGVAAFPEVLVASQDINAGAMLVAEMVEWREWRESIDLNLAVIRHAIPIQAVLGAVAQRPLAAGTPIDWGGLILPGGPGFISAVIEPGMRAVTIEVDRATTGANIIYPGDRVDVIMVLGAGSENRGSPVMSWVAGGNPPPGANLGGAAQAIVRDVRVLAVGSTIFTLGRYGRPSLTSVGTVEPVPQPDGENYTLEVAPKDAERLALAASSGRLTLAIRNVSADAFEREVDAW
ncbi:MAG: Flp pilus assembly protein CpaB, partial [Gammaproteobacteria bacterium]|nr:Flp pilus assembly protein CpaB [Gammaproteobacteria bacterium]